MELVSPSRVCSTRGLSVGALFFGAVLTIPYLLTMCLLFSVNWNLSLIMTVMAVITFVDLLILPLWALKRWRIQLSSWERRLRAIFWTTTGLFTLPYATIFAVWVNGAGSPNTRIPGIFIGYFVLQIVIFLIWTLVSLPAWAVIKSNWPFRFQDGQSCPRCGYCLRGVTSRICPECGRGFDANDLGLSVAAFEHLVAGGVDAAGQGSADRAGIPV